MADLKDQKIAPFRIRPALIPYGSKYHLEEGQKYLIFNFFYKKEANFISLIGNNEGNLLVPDDGTLVVNQIKEFKEDVFFTTPLANLKFRSNFTNRGLKESP